MICEKFKNHPMWPGPLWAKTTFLRYVKDLAIEALNELFIALTSYLAWSVQIHLHWAPLIGRKRSIARRRFKITSGLPRFPRHAFCVSSIVHNWRRRFHFVVIKSVEYWWRTWPVICFYVKKNPCVENCYSIYSTC